MIVIGELGRVRSSLVKCCCVWCQAVFGRWTLALDPDAQHTNRDAQLEGVEPDLAALGVKGVVEPL